MKVELSPGVAKALGSDAQEVRRALERRFNTGLRELKKKGDRNAAALYGSGQKIRIACFGEKEARKAGLKDPGGLGGLFTGPAATRGDFDSSGKPRKGGTALVAVDCDILRVKGVRGTILLFGEKTDYLRLLYHELLHASGRDRKHPPDPLSMYVKWVKAFLKAVKPVEEQDRRKRKARIRKLKEMWARLRARRRKLRRDLGKLRDEIEEVEAELRKLGLKKKQIKKKPGKTKRTGKSRPASPGAGADPEPGPEPMPETEEAVADEPQTDATSATAEQEPGGADDRP